MNKTKEQYPPRQSPQPKTPPRKAPPRKAPDPPRFDHRNSLPKKPRMRRTVEVHVEAGRPRGLRGRGDTDTHAGEKSIKNGFRCASAWRRRSSAGEPPTRRS